MIKTVIFDIGNVLAGFAWAQYLEEAGYSEDTKHRIAEATVNSDYWKEWDRGVKSEKELIELCCRLDPALDKEIRDFFHHVYSMVREYSYSKELVKNLKKKGYQVYLLSNYAKGHFERDQKVFSFMPYVDGGVISHQIHHVKPEPEIYKELIDRYHIKPQEAVFLDDLEVNLQGAKPFGFHTIQVESLEQLLKDLSSLGVEVGDFYQ